MKPTRLLTALAGTVVAMILGHSACAQEPPPDPAATADSALEADTDAPTLNFSAFGTLGWARSDQPWTYQRFIDRSGTFNRDSVLGAQIDARLGPEWSATLQARLAPSDHDDHQWSLVPSWAFVAWRPSNDWLLRAGKLRTPFFLHSEQLDVGQTYTEARLPHEVYSLAPSSDFTGLHVSRSWAIDDGELSLDGYQGNADIYKRVWLREGLPSAGLPPGALLRKGGVVSQGIVATLNTSDTRARLGLHRIRAQLLNGDRLIVRPEWSEPAPGLGYWKTTPQEGLSSLDRVRNLLITAGGEHRWHSGWRVAAEYFRVIQYDTEMGINAWGGYVNLYRELGAFTPYVGIATLRSVDSARHWAATLDTARAPVALGAQNAAQINALTRLAADSQLNYHQTSLVLGTSWTMSPNSRLKLEWQHTRAEQSSMFDLPAGETLVTPRRVNVYSISYSFTY